MKTKEEIRAMTRPIPRPADYKYGEKLKEWDATVPLGFDMRLFDIDPLDDRILAKLINEPQGAVMLTDQRPLIGGECRKALVLKCGPGKWMAKGWRRPMSVNPGDIVEIGNWVDLEGGGIVICREGDVRVCRY